MIDSKLCQDIRFLIVEDQPHMNELVKTVVESLGATAVTRVDSGRKALETLAHEAPDVLITDLHMADVDGLELVRRIRGLPEPARSIHIIMVTGEHHDWAEAAAAEAGVDVFITKPIWTKRLFTALEEFRARRQAR